MNNMCAGYQWKGTETKANSVPTPLLRRYWCGKHYIIMAIGNHSVHWNRWRVSWWPVFEARKRKHVVRSFVTASRGLFSYCIHKKLLQCNFIPLAHCNNFALATSAQATIHAYIYVDMFKEQCLGLGVPFECTLDLYACIYGSILLPTFPSSMAVWTSLIEQVFCEIVCKKFCQDSAWYNLKQLWNLRSSSSRSRHTPSTDWRQRAVNCKLEVLYGHV